MPIDPSMEPMLEVFIYETTTLLDQLDEILLDSEKSKCFNSDNIDAIFRIMHTIKGSAAMMDFKGISTLAHAVEDVFYIIREDTSRMDRVSEAIFELVFQSSDFFKEQIEEVQNDHDATGDPTSLINQLERLAAVMQGKDTPEEPGGPAQAAAPAEQAPPADGFCRIRVHFEDGCQMENIRAFMLMSQLKDLCEEITSDPANPESDAGLCSEIIKNGFLVICKPSVPLEELYQVIENAVNVSSYEPIEPAQPAPEPAPEAAPAPTASEPEPAPAPAPVQQAEKPQQAPPPKQPAQQPAGTTPGLPKAKQSLVSVNQTKLDQLMDLVGELVTTESMVASNPDLRGLQLDNFNKSTRELRKLTDELQDIVMSIRMVPLSGVFQKMARLVRDMSKKLGKEVEFVTAGGETEVDKTINEAIGDPFMHMIRNSMDHGIEPTEERIAAGKPAVGRVSMEAKNVGGEIVIIISDDGGGLDTERIMRKARENGLLTKPESEYTDREIFGMIMLPGFSTNQEVTEYSGRGVGMDVVRQNIEKIGGSLTIDSKRGEGSTFTIKIPLTLAIVDGMELQVGDTTYTMSITSIQQSFKVSEDVRILYNTDDTEMVMIRGECFPLIRLHQLFDAPTEVTKLEDGILLLIESGENKACIFADALLGEQQVVVKPFPNFLNKYSVKKIGLSGCTILGDGSISLILDANNLLNLSKERRM